MKAGTYQTDSLPPYCDWRRSLGLSDAAEPGAGDGKVNVDRPQPLFRPLLYRVAAGSRNSFHQITYETPRRRHSGQSSYLEFYSNY
jgi:hypothetical protein